MSLQTNITATGVTTSAHKVYPGRRVLMDVSGDTAAFNGRTVTLGYLAADSAFSPYLDALGQAVKLTSRGGYEVRAPGSGLVAVSLDGAPGANLKLDVVPAVEMSTGQ